MAIWDEPVQQTLRPPYQGGIPKTFNYIWTHSPLPDVYAKHRDMLRELHPGWEIRTWHDEDIKWWMEETVWSTFDPLIALRDLLEHAYANYNTIDKRQISDLFRLGLIWQVGGVYLDFDYTPLRNIEPLLEGAPCVMTCPSYTNIANGFIAAEQGDPFLWFCLENLEASYFSGKSVVHATGPAFVTRMYRAWEKATFTAGCRLLPKHVAYPYTYNRTDLENEEFPEAYLVHRWASLHGDVWQPIDSNKK